jgi:hypothetical protein
MDKNDATLKKINVSAIKMWNSDKSVRQESRRCFRPVVTRRPVNVIRKSIVRKYGTKIANLKKSVKTANKTQRKVIRRKILKFRIIRGGTRYVNRYVRRCN